MSFLNPTALFFSALAGFIILMYLLKLRRRREEISSTLLWLRSIEDLTANAPLQKLRQNLLMYLQILALLALAFALARPTLWMDRHTGLSRIIMIDNSASMNATDEANGMTRLERARRLARDLVANMAAGDQAMVVAFGGRARVLAPMSGEKATLQRAIDSIEPTDAPAQAREAIQLAKGVREVNPTARMTILSDGGLGYLGDAFTEKDPVDFFSVGTNENNRGIVAFDLREAFDQPGKLQAFAEVENFGAEPAQVTLRALIGEDIIQAREATIPPKSRQGFVFDGLTPGATQPFRLQLAGSDDLPTDDQIAASINFDLQTKILLVSTGNFFLERLLALLPGVEVSRIEPIAFDPAAPNDVVVFDQFTPPALGAGRYLFIDAAPPFPGFVRAPEPLKDQIILDWNQLHPITRFVDFGNLGVGEAFKLASPDWMTELAESPDAPLILAGQSRGLRLVTINFNLYASAWPLDASFPIFLANAVNWLASDGGAGGLETARHLTGDTVTLPAATNLQIIDPKGRTHKLDPSPSGESYFDQTLHAGVYQLEQDGNPAGFFTVNLLNPEESSIAPKRELISGEQKIAAGIVTKENREIWPWILGLCLGVLMLEWHLYCKRSWL